MDDGVGGPAGRSEGEGDGEEVDEETEEWLTTFSRPCSWGDTYPKPIHTHRGRYFKLLKKFSTHNQTFF